MRWHLIGDAFAAGRTSSRRGRPLLRAGAGVSGTLVSVGRSSFGNRAACAAAAASAAGTLIHTQESLDPIGQNQIGDWVLTQPDETGAQVIHPRDHDKRL